MDAYLKLENIKGKKVVVHCATQEQWDKVSKIVDGYKNHTTYGIYKENSCIRNHNNYFTYCDKSWYIANYFTIIPAKDFIMANPQIEKPQTFCIKSDNPLLLQAFAKDVKKLGYYISSKITNGICYLYNNISTPKDKKSYCDLALLDANWHKEYDQIHFNLPEDYTKALSYLKDSIESLYWEENQTPQYKVGDWVVVKKEKLDGTYGGNNLLHIFKKDYIFSIVNMEKSGLKEIGLWLYSKESAGAISINLVRLATPEEIEKATKKPVFYDENGNAIYVGDKYFLVNTKCYSIHKNECGGLCSYENDDILKVFSTENAAKEWIAKNQQKICYIGDKQFPVYVSKGKIVADNKEIDIEHIKNVICMCKSIPASGSIKKYNWQFSISTFKIGCCNNVTIEQLQKIVDVYNELNK